MNQVKKKSNKRIILLWDLLIILSIAVTIFMIYTDDGSGIGFIFVFIPAYCYLCRWECIECAIKEEACEEMIKKLEKYQQTLQEEK